MMVIKMNINEFKDLLVKHLPQIKDDTAIVDNNVIVIHGVKDSDDLISLIEEIRHSETDLLFDDLNYVAMDSQNFITVELTFTNY